jgi:Asp-tRNA(Asn)/Glu-tRNA(Gln) amidotransferase A subunit family amidase
MDGVIPFSKIFDTLGLIAKTVIDLAQVIRIVEDDSGLDRSRHRIQNPLPATWSGLRIGVLNPEKWK